MATAVINGTVKGLIGETEPDAEVTLTPIGSTAAMIDGTVLRVGSPQTYPLVSGLSLTVTQGAWRIVIAPTGGRNGQPAFPSIDVSLNITGNLTWAQIVGTVPPAGPLTPTQYQELDERLDELEANPTQPGTGGGGGGVEEDLEGDWAHLRIGGGGLITNLSQAVAADGTHTLVAGSDGRTYHFDPVTHEWVMDQTEVTLGGYVPTSTEETATPGRAVAPSLPTTQWALFLNDVWRTTDGGRSWTSMKTGILVRGNDVWRSYGPRIAVDPRQPNHVLVGTQYAGLLRTTNGTKPTAVALPAGVDALAGRRTWLKGKAYGLINRAHKSGVTEDEACAGVTAVMFDPSSPATAGGLTSRAFAVVASGDVIKTEDAGATWTRLNAPYPFVGQSLSLSPHNGDLLVITPTLAYSITRAAATTGGTFTITITDAAGSATTAALDHHATSAQILTAVNALGKGTWLINRYVNEATWVTNQTIDFLLYHRTDTQMPATGYTMTLDGTGVAGGALTMRRDTVALGDSQNKLWRLRAGAWLDRTPGSPARPWNGVRHNPHIAGHVVLGGIQGNDLPNRIRVSLNDGDAWGSPTAITPDTATSDVPWLAEVVKVGGGSVQGFGDVAWSPTDPKKFLNAEGTGVWEYELSTVTANNPAITVRARTAGIEHLVANDLLPLPKKAGDVDTRVLQASWDRPIFKLTDRSKYPSTYLPTTAFGSCWALGAIPDDPDFIVATIMNHQLGTDAARSATSTDRADTWTAIAARPDASNFSWGQGFICPSTRQNWIWTSPGSKVPHFTLDGGATWSPISLPGGALATATDTTQSSNWARRKAVVALGPLTFLLMVKGQGVFRTTDGGATWTKRADWSAVTAAMGTSNDAFGARLISVDPATGKPGWGAGAELWWITGMITSSGDYAKLEASAKSTDGGVTWSKVQGVGTIAALAFGPRLDGKAGYAVLASGWDAQGLPATLLSQDGGATWDEVGGSPGESFKPATCAAGDPLVPGVFYLGTSSGSETLTVTDPANLPVRWADVQEKPETFPPAQHTQPATSITDLVEFIEDAVGSLFTRSTHVGASVSYNDPAGTLVITVTGGGGGGTSSPLPANVHHAHHFYYTDPTVARPAVDAGVVLVWIGPPGEGGALPANMGPLDIASLKPAT